MMLKMAATLESASHYETTAVEAPSQNLLPRVVSPVYTCHSTLHFAGIHGNL